MQQNPDELWPWPAPPPPRPPRRRGGLGLLLAVTVLAAGAGAAGVVALHETAVQPADSSSAGQGPPAAAPEGTGKTTLNAQSVADAVEPGTVDVVAPDAYSGLVSQGTGMILSSDGLVLTNNHVIRDSTSVKVQLVTTGKTYTARVLGYDAADDVALLQVNGASGLHTIATADSSQVRVSQPVLALGNAEGQGGPPTIAPGSVTALNQTISPSDSATGATETLHGTIQTSAQVAAGDSGGPLANARGQVVGMVTASGASLDFGSSGTISGYAIPIDSALSIAHQITANRSSSRVSIGLPGFIGVRVADASTGCSSGTGAVDSGALICSVLPGTAASRAGLSAGDVIRSVNGRSIASQADLSAATSGLHAGAVIGLGYVDISGKSQTAHLVLGKGPAG
jgi:S1-C subfamily serine protease